jgi:hypothetical protein
MARTYAGAFVEMVKREFASKYHKDLVLRLETGPAPSSELTKLSEELRREFPFMTGFAAGGDGDRYWRISVSVRPGASASELRQELARWASTKEPWVRSYSIYQRSLWRSAKRS